MMKGTLNLRLLLISPSARFMMPLTREQQLRDAIKQGKQCLPGEGIAVNSSHGDLNLNGLSVLEAQKAIIKWLEKNEAGKATVTYKLRDSLFSRQRYWGEPFPLLKFSDGTVRLLSEDELPLCPPEISNYKPTAEGNSPLALVRIMGGGYRPKNWQASAAGNAYHAAMGRLLLVLLAVLRSPQRQAGLGSGG